MQLTQQRTSDYVILHALIAVYFTQSVYEKCRGRILDRMRATLSSVGSVSAGSASAGSSSGRTVREAEGLHDACRAYGLLLHSSRARETHEHREISAQVKCM